MSSILIKNGQVYDPAYGINGPADISISGDCIVVGNDDFSPETIVDASGCLVIPGLIDYHLHVYTDGCDGGVNADIACLPNGITTAVDGGSCGESNYRIFHKYNIAHAETTIKSCLNVCSTGLASTRFVENLNPDYFAFDRIRELFSLYPEELVGIKVRMSKGIIPDNDYRPLERSLEIAEELGCPVVVHMTNPAVSTAAVVSMLRAGDVFCHAFHSQGETILDGKKVKPEVFEAQRRGVVFDACHGKVNFAFSTALAAIEDGFLPDIISTDLSPKTMYREPVISLPRILAKFIAMGLSLEQVIDRSTVKPATALGMVHDLASLVPGTVADIALFKLTDIPCSFGDYQGQQIQGHHVLVPQMTIKRGTILYSSSAV